MTAPKTVPEEIAETERLGRELFSRSHARPRIPWYAFEKARDNKGLSVDRMDFADEASMARIGKRNATKRPLRADGQTPTFRGWAILPVAKAKQNGRTIEYSPENDNPYHSDIILPASDDGNSPKTHAQNLADASSLKRYVCSKSSQPGTSPNIK